MNVSIFSDNCTIIYEDEKKESALDILKRRCASVEITKRELEKMKDEKGYRIISS